MSHSEKPLNILLVGGSGTGAEPDLTAISELPLSDMIPSLAEKMGEAEATLQMMDNATAEHVFIEGIGVPYDGVIIDVDALGDDWKQKVSALMPSVPDIPVLFFSDTHNHKVEGIVPGFKQFICNDAQPRSLENNNKAEAAKEGFAKAVIAQQAFHNKPVFIIIDDEPSQSRMNEAFLNKTHPDADVLHYHNYDEALEEIAKLDRPCAGVIADNDTGSRYTGEDFCRDFDGIVPILFKSGSEKNADGLSTTSYYDKALGQNFREALLARFDGTLIAKSEDMSSKANEVAARESGVPNGQPGSLTDETTNLGVISAEQGLRI